jgi:tRNA-dihydrouridine synthase B
MSYWQEKLKIRNLEFPRFISGPLDGITDSPFRKLVRKFSKDELLYTEMRHVACVANESDEHKSIKFDLCERPLNYQFAANKIDFIDRAVELVLEKGVDLIDLNIGCPAKNIISSGSGSALMDDLPRLKEILVHFRKKIEHIPFTVKFRAGFKVQNALDVAKLAQDCGVDAIAIHPRLQTQKFSGTPDYDLAGKVKAQSCVPVLISGGIVDFETAKMVYEQSGVDGYLIGQAMYAKPWKLKELHEHSLGNSFSVDNTIILECALEHLDNLLEYYGREGIFIFRKNVPWYLKGMESASDAKNVIFSTDSVDVVKKELVNFLTK